MTNAPSRAFWCFAPIYRRFRTVENHALVVESYAYCTNDTERIVSGYLYYWYVIGYCSMLYYTDILSTIEFDTIIFDTM